MRRDFWIYKTRYRCEFDRPARSSKYSASISNAPCTAVRSCAMRTAALAEGLPLDFHTPNIYRTVIFQNELIRCAARRAFLIGRINNEWLANRHAFPRVSAISYLSALFFHIFSRKREKIWPPEARHAVPFHNAEKRAAGGPLRPCGKRQNVLR